MRVRRRGSGIRLAGLLLAIAVLARTCQVAPLPDPGSERSESDGTPVTADPATADPATAEAVRAVVESVADQLWRLIGEALVLDDAPPIRR